MTNMADMTVDEFRSAMDSDEGFKSKRRALVLFSLLLLAISVSGAVIKEVNTFIFKIEFTNHDGLIYLLVVAVLSCMLRYYAYSEKYHAQLFNFWSHRLLGNSRIFHYDREREEVRGLLGKRVEVYGGDEPGIEYPEYIKTGFLKRAIGYPSEGENEQHGIFTYTESISLNSYDEKWTRADFRKLLRTELMYRVAAWLKYRETLDLVSPYLLGLSSLVVFVIGCFVL